MNPLHPRHMTDDQRLHEVFRLLALGVVRLRARQSSGLSAAEGESSLHIRLTGAVMRTRDDGEPHDRLDPRARGRA